MHRSAKCVFVNKVIEVTSLSHLLLLFLILISIYLYRVWDLDGNENTTLRLRSPGISVCWHPEEVFKVGGVCVRYTLILGGLGSVSRFM